MKIIKIREHQEGRRHWEKESWKCLQMTWFKMSCNMRHFPHGTLELIPENRDLQSSRITCCTTGGQIHINIQIPSKLVSKSVLAALMCMNESLSVFKSVCVCQWEGSSKTERKWPSALINKTLESVGINANGRHVQNDVCIRQIFKIKPEGHICVRLVILKLPPITACY